MPEEGTARDYTGEVRALVDKHMTDAGSYNAAVLASLIEAELRTKDPQLLAGWLDQRAGSILRDMVTKIDASSRAHARATSSQRAFRMAFRSFEADQDPAVFDRWLNTRFTVGEEQNRKPFRHMTKAECTSVADGYEQQAARQKLQAAFLRAVAKKVDAGQTVGEVFSERQLARLWAGLSGEPAATAEDPPQQTAAA